MRDIGWTRPLALIAFISILGCKLAKKEIYPHKVLSLPAATNSVGMNFVRLPGGTFKMGNSEFRAPVHTVSLSPFWIETTEVTNVQYEALMPKHKRGKASLGDQDPVVGISKDEAKEFAAKLSAKESKNYRLPTDAEWEYAARGGLEGKDFPWGNDVSADRVHSGLIGRSEHAVKVGSFAPNAYGLFDIVGNVQEWVEDTDLEFNHRTGVETNPIHKRENRLGLTRGGSFATWYPFVWEASPAVFDKDPELQFDTGFRLVRSE
jgi:formylglycine-generating enzyme required for sulfatase activity